MGSNPRGRAFHKNSVFARDIPENLRARTRLTSERRHLVSQDAGENAHDAPRRLPGEPGDSRAAAEPTGGEADPRATWQ